MNNLKICSCVVWWLFFIYSATAEKFASLSKNEKIGASFSFAKNNQLSLVIKNISKEDFSLTSNIDHLIRTGLQGFPHDAAIQFRSNDKRVIKLRDQAGNGWLYPNLYNSKIDFQIIDGKFRNNLDASFGNLLVTGDSSISRPINYMTGMKLISSELRSADEFRVMWKIMTKEAGIDVAKEIVSDWFPCRSTLSKLNE